MENGSDRGNDDERDVLMAELKGHLPFIKDLIEANNMVIDEKRRAILRRLYLVISTQSDMLLDDINQILGTIRKLKTNYDISIIKSISEAMESDEPNERNQ